jgi:hypothetical protein
MGELKKEYQKLEGGRMKKRKGQIEVDGPYLDSHFGSMPQRLHHLPCYNKVDQQTMEQGWYNCVYGILSQHHTKKNMRSMQSNHCNYHQRV